MEFSDEPRWELHVAIRWSPSGSVTLSYDGIPPKRNEGPTFLLLYEKVMEALVHPKLKLQEGLMEGLGHWLSEIQEGFKRRL